MRKIHDTQIIAAWQNPKVTRVIPLRTRSEISDEYESSINIGEKKNPEDKERQSNQNAHTLNRDVNQSGGTRAQEGERVCI